MRSKIVNTTIIVITTMLIMTGSYYLFSEIGLINKTNNYLNVQNNGVIKCNENVTIDESGISLAVGKIYDSVVMIQTFSNNKEISTGSGFFYKTDDKYAYIITNNHVIAGGDDYKIVLANDEIVKAEVTGGDSYLDLAVMKVDKKYALQVAKLGDSNNSNLGDTIFTVGAPLGYDYRGSVTKGTLSGKNRMVSVSVASDDDWIMKVIQVDAAINPGNSGGPLLNINGEVIGVNSLKLVKDEIEGMGFAIPIEDALKYVPDLEKGKKIERPLIGITMTNLNDVYTLYQNGIKISSSITEGVVVLGTVESSGASKAGLKKGDVITKINGATVKNMAFLKYELYKYQPEDKIDMTVLRDDKEINMKIYLTKNND